MLGKKQKTQISFTGQSRMTQCPVCNAELTWRIFQKPSVRIESTVAQHQPGCPGGGIDPAELQEYTIEQVQDLVARREPGTPTE